MKKAGESLKSLSRSWFSNIPIKIKFIKDSIALSPSNNYEFERFIEEKKCCLIAITILRKLIFPQSTFVTFLPRSTPRYLARGKISHEDRGIRLSTSQRRRERRRGRREKKRVEGGGRRARVPDGSLVSLFAARKSSPFPTSGLQPRCTTVPHNRSSVASSEIQSRPILS